MTLDHQQRFFTGWGDDPPSLRHVIGEESLKTPSLGLVWSSQIACRVVLKKRPVYGYGYGSGSGMGSSARAEEALGSMRRIEALLEGVKNMPVQRLKDDIQELQVKCLFYC